MPSSPDTIDAVPTTDGDLFKMIEDGLANLPGVRNKDGDGTAILRFQTTSVYEVKRSVLKAAMSSLKMKALLSGGFDHHDHLLLRLLMEFAGISDIELQAKLKQRAKKGKPHGT